MKKVNRKKNLGQVNLERKVDYTDCETVLVVLMNKMLLLFN